MNTAPLLEVENLHCRFEVSKPWLNRVLEREPRRWLHAVNGVSFRVQRGETYALVGESGCGKSTVARLIVGLYHPDAGQMRFDGLPLGAQRPSSTRRRFQMIFQDPFASLNPRWRVDKIIAEPLKVFGMAHSNSEIQRRVADLLSQVGLAAQDGRKFPHEFSGGQRQRICIARALANRPEFLVCDEPTSALDVSVQAQILNLMRDLQDELGLTYLFISHDLAVVRHMATRIGVMYLGKLVEEASSRDLFAQPQHPYTQMLLATIPDIRLDQPRKLSARGEVPDPINPPSGCAFHPRCPVALPACQHQAPTLEQRQAEHWVSCVV